MNAYVSSAVGDAVARTQGLTTVGRDSYNRMFKINLAQGYLPGGVSLISPDPAVHWSSSQLDAPSFGGGRMHVTAMMESGQIDPANYYHWMQPAGPGGAVTVSYEWAGFTASAWTGERGGGPFQSAPADAFVATAQVDHALRTGYAIDGWRLIAEMGGGRRLSPDHTQFEAGSNYVRAAVERAFGPVTASFGAGSLIEPQGPLGSYLPQRSGYALPSKTGFVSLGANWAVAPGVSFHGQGSLGRTDLSGSFLQTAGPALSSSWTMSLDADCHVLGLACTAAHLTLSQPLRIERGTFTALLPDVPDTEEDPLTFSVRRFGAAPSGREVDLRLQAERDFGNLGQLRLEGVASRQPGNIQEAAPAAGVAVGWRTQF
jgi:hypothetical protein